MSKFKNISLIPYNKNGYSLFFIIDHLGKRDLFFDFFVKNLVERVYAKNTVQLYSIAVASFLDYITESVKHHEENKIIIDGYKLSEIISLFPIFISSGEQSANPFIKSISKKLKAIPKNGSTEETYIAGINKYLSLSEDFKTRIIENKNEYPEYEHISIEKLFPHINEKRSLTSFEKFNINKNNMLSSVISGGANFKRMSALKKTKKKQINRQQEDLKIFPIDYSILFINSAKNYLEKTLISLLATSGIRLSEALLLTFDDINLQEREVYIKSPHDKKLEDYWNYFTYEEKTQLPFKSRVTTYTFLISPFEDCFWNNLLEYIKKERISSNRHPFIFTNNDGSPLIFNDKKFTQRFRTLSKKIVGEHYSPHSLRHMYISYLVNYFPLSSNQYGLPVHQVQKLVGHSNINSTQVYVHHDLDLLKQKQKDYFDNLGSNYNNKKIEKILNQLKPES